MKMLPYIARRSVCRWGRGSLCPNVAIHAKSLSASTCLNVKLLQHPWWNGLGLNQTSEKRSLTQFSIEKLLENLSTWHTPIPTSRIVSESCADSCQNLNSHILKLAKEFSGTMQAPGIMGFSFEIMNPQYFRALWIAIGEEKFLQEGSLLALCLDLDLHRYLDFPRNKPPFQALDARAVCYLLKFHWQI